jgi:hypothetical protein
MAGDETREERAARHEAAAEYLRSGIYEDKPWLKGVVSYEGPAQCWENIAAKVRAGEL